MAAAAAEAEVAAASEFSSWHLHIYDEDQSPQRDFLGKVKLFPFFCLVNDGAVDEPGGLEWVQQLVGRARHQLISEKARHLMSRLTFEGPVAVVQVSQKIYKSKAGLCLEMRWFGSTFPWINR